MDKAVLVARILLGLIFVVFGINGFLNFLPPLELSAQAAAFFNALVNAGHFWTLEKVTEIVGGALILSGFMVPLGAVLLAPIVLNIFLFHLFLDPANIAVAIVVLALEVLIAWGYRDSFRNVLEVGAKPTRRSPRG